MNNNEAKFILTAYRPNGRDAEDPAFSAALVQARQDPVLGAWFTREQAFDMAMAAQLGAVVPPAGLREAILTGARVSRGQPVVQRWPAWLALAASIVILLGVGTMRWIHSSTRIDPLTAFAMADARTEAPMYMGPATNDLHRTLADSSTRLASLSVDFDTLRRTGCHTLSFGGHDVLQICFQRGGTWFHLYMVRKEDFPEIASTSKPRILKQDGWSAMKWADAAHMFIVTTQADSATLRGLL